MYRGVPYFLLFSVYAVVNTYLPIVLRTLGFSTAEIGILLGIIEITGITVPFLITPKLDKTGHYGLVMLLFGLDVAVLLLPLIRFQSFFITAAFFGVFAVGFKGLVPVLDGFTAKALGARDAQYGKIRAAGSIGFVCMNVFLQLNPIISGQKPFSVILTISGTAFIFVLSLLRVPDLFNTVLLKQDAEVQPYNSTAEEQPEQSFSGFPGRFWNCILLIFLAFLGLVPCQRFFSLYVEEYVKMDVAAGLWALSAMVEVPVMIMSGKLISRFGKEKLLFICLASIAVRNACYILLPGVSGAVAGQLLHSISFGLFHPLSVLLCVSYSCGKTATALMFFTAANGLANVMGSMMGGYIIEYGGYPALFLFFNVFPLLGMLLYFFTVRIRPAYK
ncbi:MAG: MFS transporter [Treponema sp.]